MNYRVWLYSTLAVVSVWGAFSFIGYGSNSDSLFANVAGLSGTKTFTSVESFGIKNIDSKKMKAILTETERNFAKLPGESEEVPDPCPPGWTGWIIGVWVNFGTGHSGKMKTYFYPDGTSCEEHWEANNVFGINKELVYATNWHFEKDASQPKQD